MTPVELAETNLTLLSVMDMLEKSCVMAVLAYLLIRTDYFSRLFIRQENLRQQAVLCGVFILIALYGAFNGLQVEGALVSLLHSGALLAGLLFGLKMGVVVGAVSAALRYVIGGDTIIISTSVALLAGILAGLYRIAMGEKRVTTRNAAVFTAGFELFIRGLPFLKLDDPDLIQQQLEILLPMLLGNVTMVAIFVFVVTTLKEVRENRLLKERLETELQMAREIQHSLVPSYFGPFQECPSLSLYGLLQPAREIGGDVYDFFFLGKNRFCFMIGDVSGKGMPAALFMAATRTLFKAQTDWEEDIAAVVGRVNRELCRGNDVSQFVTMFCGIIELESGRLSYCNAGHNPPYLLLPDGSQERLGARHGPAAGVCEEFKYSCGEKFIAPGTLLLLYTDGVTEAESEDGRMFTEKRLEEVLKKNDVSCPQLTVEAVTGAVREFAGKAQQSDDITLLAWCYGAKEQ